MTGAVAAAAVLGPPFIGFDGDLGATGSTATITGTTRTASVQAGTETLTIGQVDLGGGPSLEFDDNGAGFVIAGATIDVTDGHTLQARAVGTLSVGDGVSVTLTSSNGRVAAEFTLQRV